MKLHCWNGQSRLGHRPTRPWRPSPQGLSAQGWDRGTREVLDGEADSSEQRHGEVGSWVGEMVGEVGDPIWSPVKEEAHQRVVSTRCGSARGKRRWGAMSSGGGRWTKPLNFKGIQRFLKKSDKFYKIPYPYPILDYKFILTHLYSNIGSSFISGNRYLVYFILNRTDHLRVLPPLSQVYHCFKINKECSQVTYKYCTLIWVTCAV
jgi:hypothetical protein